MNLWKHLRPLSCWKFCQEVSCGPKNNPVLKNGHIICTEQAWCWPENSLAISSWNNRKLGSYSEIHDFACPLPTKHYYKRGKALEKCRLSGLLLCERWVNYLVLCVHLILIWLKIVWKESAIYNTAAKAHVYLLSIAYMLFEPWFITSPCSMCTVLIWSKYWGKQNMILSTIRLWVFKFKQKHML